MNDVSERALSAADYLGRLLPAILADAPSASRAATTVVQMSVIDQPECAYVYRIQGSEVAVIPGISDRADLGLAFTTSALDAFQRNRLDITHALRSGALRVHGDISLLSWLASRLEQVRY